MNNAHRLRIALITCDDIFEAGGVGTAKTLLNLPLIWLGSKLTCSSEVCRSAGVFLQHSPLVSSIGGSKRP